MTLDVGSTTRTDQDLLTGSIVATRPGASWIGDPQPSALLRVLSRARLRSIALRRTLRAPSLAASSHKTAVEHE